MRPRTRARGSHAEARAPAEVLHGEQVSTTIRLRVQTRNIEEGRDARRDWQQPNAALDISIGGVLCEHHGEAMACIIVQLLQSSTAAPRLAWMSEEPLAPLAPAASTPAHSMTSAAVKAV